MFVGSLVPLAVGLGCSGSDKTFKPRVPETTSGSSPAGSSPAPPSTTELLFPTLEGRLERMVAGDVKVLIFIRADCPIANRYAPEIRRLCTAYADGVSWWLVYPDAQGSRAGIEAHLAEYDLPCNAVGDPQHQLVRQTGATITPEAAVYDKDNRLIYCGRIDDWYAGFGRARPKPTQHDLEDAIRAALEGREVATLRQPAVGCYIGDLAADADSTDDEVP